MKKNFSTLILLVALFKLSAQIEIICDEVELAKKPLSEVTYVEAIETRIAGKLEACEFKFRNEPIVATEIHPFVEALYFAYADHRPISISPDMIWLLICQGFSIHVNNNMEELRPKFVAFNGKKKLIVNTQPISLAFEKGSIKSPWSLAFPILADSISKYVKKDIHTLYIQSFSTTTFMEKAAYEVALLDGMSGYFEYEYATACGIPLIKIEGTKADWLKIKKGIQGFKGYNIDNWIDALDPIIQQFVDASENKIDHIFWSNMFKEKNESGGPYITGWVIKFFPYINQGGNSMTKNPYIDREPGEFLEGLTTNDFNNGLSKAEFIWNYFDTKYEMEFLAGFIGIRQNKKSLTLRPEIGWLVKDKQNKKLTASAEEETTGTIDDSNTYGWKTYLFISFIGLVIVYILFRIVRKK